MVDSCIVYNMLHFPTSTTPTERCQSVVLPPSARGNGEKDQRLFRESSTGLDLLSLRNPPAPQTRHSSPRQRDESGREGEGSQRCLLATRPRRTSESCRPHLRMFKVSERTARMEVRNDSQVQSIESPGAVKLTSQTLPTSKLLPCTARRALAAQTTPSKWFSSSGDEREHE